MAAPAALPHALWVHGPDGLVGTLYRSEPLAFSYCASWLANAAATPLHPAIPLGEGRIDTPYVAAFFENLLPEGDQRELISLREQVTTVFGLLSRVGGESAGAEVLPVLVPGERVMAERLVQKITSLSRGMCQRLASG